MIKKLISLTLIIVMISSVLCISTNASGVAGNYYYTDIKSYVRGQLIDSYNVGGKTVILCEALQSYGFNVLWNGTDRTLTITDRYGSATSNASDSLSGAIGAVAGNYFYTDIVTYFNGVKMESYNLGGRTVIPATALRDLGYDVVWDDANRRVLIDTDTANFVAGTSAIDNVTIKPNQTYHGTIAITADAVNFNGNRLITAHDCYIETSLDKKIYVPFKAFADCLGISYSWNSGTSTLSVSVPADKIIAAKQSKLKTNYKNYGVVEYEIRDIVFNIVNGGKTYNNVDAVVYGTEVFVEAQSLATALDFFCVNQVDFYTKTMMYLVYSGMYQP
ncbi:MAG: stalk domain-containing protein [Clostridia bacterium]|nr:stalk domain-containing protein [Clostridia bacterium]